MPLRVAEKPGGVVTFRALKFCSPSFRVRLSEKEVWAPAVLEAEAALKPGAKGREPSGQGRPSGPWSTVKNWRETWLESAESHGVHSL